MFRVLSFFLLAASLFLMGCSNAVTFLSTDQVKERTGLLYLPGQSDFPEADAVVLYENRDITMKITESYRLITNEVLHRVVKVLKNVDENSYEVFYFNSKEKLLSLQARTVKPDGTVIELKEEDYLHSSGSGGAEFYSDRREVRFNYPAVEKDCIVEFILNVRNEYPFMYERWNIQGPYPKIVSIYNLSIPKFLLASEVNGGVNWDWKYYPVNLELPKPEVLKNVSPDKMNEAVTFSWKLTDIPAFEPEPNMPPASKYLQKVKFAPTHFNTWDDLSTEYYADIKDKFETNGSVLEKALALTANCKTDIEKIDAVYKYVQKLRYVSINLNNSGTIPHKASEVLAKQYGDCKDKSTLLVSMLRGLNIKANPVLVLTADEGDMFVSFPNWDFNHMIVKATTSDNKVFWLDGTSEFSTIYDVPAMDEGIRVLVIKEDGKSSIEAIALSNASDNTTSIDIDYELTKEFDAKYKIKLKYKGEQNTVNRYFFKDKTAEDIKKHCSSMLANELSGAEFSNCKVEYIDSLKPEVHLSFDVLAKNAAQVQGDLVLLSSDPYPFGIGMKWLVKEKRQYPVWLDFANILTKNVTIHLPEGVSLKSCPENIVVLEKGLNYRKDFNVVDKKIVLKEELKLPDSFIDVQYYEKLKKGFDRINTKSKERVVLIKN